MPLLPSSGQLLFDVQFEILELAGGLEVGALGFIKEFAILRDPVIRDGVGGLPAGQVSAVE
jgi:hypothetical protein